MKVFAKRGDVRLAYSNQPFKSTAPYYWAHNTQPGDPRYPKWESELAYGMPSAKFRYDRANGGYVWDSEDMKPDETWRSEGTARRTPVLDTFTIKKLSPREREVESSPGIIDMF